MIDRTHLVNLVNPAILSNKHETVAPYSASILIICQHDFPQRPPAVLGSTHNCEDALTTPRWNSGGVDHVHALFSDTAPGGIFVCAGDNCADSTA